MLDLFTVCLCHHAVIAHRFTIENLFQSSCVLLMSSRESMHIPSVDVNLFDSCQSHQVRRLQNSSSFKLMDLAKEMARLWHFGIWHYSL